MKKTMPCRRQGEKGRCVGEESKILPHFPKTPRQKCCTFSSLQSQFFWALSDFPGSSSHRFPYVSQSSLQLNMCSEIVLPFKVPFVPEVKTGPTFSVAFLKSTGFGTTQNWPAIPDSHLISWIALSRLYKRIRKVWALDIDSIMLNLGQITQPLHTSVSLTIMAQRLKRLPGMRETRVWSLGREDPLEKEMATHSSTLAWKIPWREEPGMLQSMGSQRVGHDWATSLQVEITEWNY